MRLTSSRLMLVASLAAAPLLAAGTPAAAQTSILNSVLESVGIKDQEKPDIIYRDRAPLVVPPKMELRPPQEPVSRTTSAWPTDQDVVKKRKADKEKNLPRTEQYSYRMGGDKTTLSIQEMQAGREAGAGLNTTRPSPFNDPLNAERFDQNFQKQMRQGSRAKTEVVEVEPERRYLTDPPTGYRAPSDKASRAIPKTGAVIAETDNEQASPWTFWRQTQRP